MPLTLNNVSFSYGKRLVLDSLDLEINEGNMTALMGPSGSGKSTLIGLLVDQLKPATGRIQYPPQVKDNGTLRKQEIAWIMQTANVFTKRTARENITLPLVLRGIPKEQREKRADNALHMVNLKARSHDRAGQLSGGEKQRVAVARAIAMESALLIADEPTVALDKKNREALIAALRQSAASGAIVLIATHDPEVSDACDEIIQL